MRARTVAKSYHAAGRLRVEMRHSRFARPRCAHALKAAVHCPEPGPLPIAEFGGALCRVDNVGEQHRRQYLSKRKGPMRPPRARLWPCRVAKRGKRPGGERY